MVPTLSGRIQTRIFLLLVIGIPWTLIVTPLLPRPAGVGVGTVYKTTFWILAEVLIVGSLVWEPLYHGLMQFRWEKDWPVMFSLLEAIPEGIVASPPRPRHRTGGQAVRRRHLLIDFVILWVLVWLAAWARCEWSRTAGDSGEASSCEPARGRSHQSHLGDRLHRHRGHHRRRPGDGQPVSAYQTAGGDR